MKMVSWTPSFSLKLCSALDVPIGSLSQGFPGVCQTLYYCFAAEAEIFFKPAFATNTVYLLKIKLLFLSFSLTHVDVEHDTFVQYMYICVRCIMYSYTHTMHPLKALIYFFLFTPSFYRSAACKVTLTQASVSFRFPRLIRGYMRSRNPACYFHV